MVLLSGGTGLLGRAIARRLLEGGRPVRILTRDPAGASDLEAAGAEVVAGDLTDPASLDRALTGVTHVVTTANAFTVRARGAVKRVDVLGNQTLIDAAKRAGYGSSSSRPPGCRTRTRGSTSSPPSGTRRRISAAAASPGRSCGPARSWRSGR